MLAQSRILLQIAQQGPSLFQMLGTNLDRRLSLREFGSTFPTVKSLDANANGRIADTELSGSYHLVFELPPSPLAGLAPWPAAAQSTDAVIPGDNRLHGPRWVVRMDRNRDGDVLAREFLGPIELLACADRHRDSLIEPDEAERWSQCDETADAAF